MQGEGDIQPWEGEPQLHVRLAIGKLAEESAELAGICARISIQGYSGTDPKSGKSNAHALADEMSDVMAAINFVYERTGCMAVQNRIDKKRAGYKRWFALIGLG